MWSYTDFHHKGGQCAPGAFPLPPTAADKFLPGARPSASYAARVWLSFQSHAAFRGVTPSLERVFWSSLGLLLKETEASVDWDIEALTPLCRNPG